jgi:hypothetical protein
MTGKLKKLATNLVLEVFLYYTWFWAKSLKFSDCSNLISLEFQQSSRLQNIITFKPFVVSGCVNNRWKQKKTYIYLLCLALSPILVIRAPELES